MEQHTNGEEREVPGPLKDLDAAALQARMEKAQGDPTEEKREFGQNTAGLCQTDHLVRRAARRQLWLIVGCVLFVLAGAAALSLRFGNLFSGEKAADQTVALTGKEAPWLSFSDGMLSYNADYTGDVPQSIIIPDTFDGKAVAGIADEGFAQRTEITELTVGGNVPLIGVRAPVSPELIWAAYRRYPTEHLTDVYLLRMLPRQKDSFTSEHMLSRIVRRLPIFPLERMCYPLAPALFRIAALYGGTLPFPPLCLKSDKAPLKIALLLPKLSFPMQVPLERALFRAALLLRK